MYYECHITLDPADVEKLRNDIELLACAHGFKVAKFTMDSGDTFMTSKETDVERLLEDMNSVLTALSSIIKIRRAKIEKIIFDTNMFKGMPT